MDEPDASHLLQLAENYRVRANNEADPNTARILREIADDLDVEARKLGDRF